MQNIIETIFTEPLFLIIGLIIVVILSLAVFKKLFKMALLVVTIFIAYSTFIYYQSEKRIDNALKKAIEDVKDVDAKKIQKKFKKSLDDVKEKTEDFIKEND